MDSRELGLVLARQLLKVEDLHYGLWDNGLALTLANLPAAQQSYNELLIAQLPAPADGPRILDVGCGTGHLMRQLLDLGYRVDGVIPARDLGALVHRRCGDCAGYRPRIYECRFEDLPAEAGDPGYDVALFSESFQYVPIPAALGGAARVLKPGGLLVICDFFKTDAHGDGGPGDRSFGGGHAWSEFRRRVEETAFVPIKEEDLTSRVGPTLDLVNDLLMNRARPAAVTLHSYLSGRYPVLTRLALWMARKRLAKLNFKYFSGHRCREVFERYKTYRLLLYRLPAGA